jgi:predicted HNH restriction endonuclease
VETHHVVPVQADRYLADDASNLLPVCCACHDAIEGMSWAQLHTAYGIEQW